MGGTDKGYLSLALSSYSTSIIFWSDAFLLKLKISFLYYYLEVLSLIVEKDSYFFRV